MRVSGFGIDADYVKGTAIKDQLIFIKKHDPDSYKILMEYQERGADFENENWYEWNGTLASVYGTVNGIADMFARAMTEETGFYFEAHLKMKTGESVIIYMGDARGKSKELKAIFARYLAELGVTEFVAEHQSVNEDC